MNIFSNAIFLYNLTVNNIKEYFKKSSSIKSDELITNSVNWFGHATTIINLYNKVIITDPVLCNLLGYFKRVVEKPSYIKDLNGKTLLIMKEMKKKLLL